MSKTRELGVPEIVVTMYDVTVCGVVVLRPDSISATQWLRFWEHVKEVEMR